MHFVTFVKSLLAIALTGLVILCAGIPALAAPPQSPLAPESATDKPFVVEYYYKVKWGHADEFIALFRKNHYPLLKKQVELGRMLKVSGVSPRYHTTEDGRWTTASPSSSRTQPSPTMGLTRRRSSSNSIPIRIRTRRKNSGASK